MTGPVRRRRCSAASVAYEFLALTALATRREPFPLHRQVRLCWQKRRDYERNERAGAQGCGCTGTSCAATPTCASR